MARCIVKDLVQSGVSEVTKISSKDQTLQRTGDHILEGFSQDRVQQRLVECLRW